MSVIKDGEFVEHDVPQREDAAKVLNLAFDHLFAGVPTTVTITPENGNWRNDHTLRFPPHLNRTLTSAREGGIVIMCFVVQKESDVTSKGAFRITQRDIAEHVGVSQRSVSFALREPERVSASMRQRILKAVNELGYRTNGGARAMRTGRFDCIALLQDIHNYRSDVNTALLKALLTVTERLEQQLSLASIPDCQLGNDSFTPRILTELSVDGMLLNYHTQLPPSMENLLRKGGVPFVHINRKSDANAVYADALGAARSLTQLLIGHGHRNIVYVDLSYRNQLGPERHYAREDHLAGYRETMQSAGLEPRLLTDESGEVSAAVSTRMWVKRLLSDPRPSAVIFHSNQNVYSFLDVCEYEGVRVPVDISVATFDRAPVQRGISVATMVDPLGAVAEQSMAMLMERIENPNTEQASRVVECTLSMGESIFVHEEVLL